MMSRRGFTLLEMLVATGVFLVGFTAAYSLFLVGIRNRALSNSTLHGTLVASSQIATMRLLAANEPFYGIGSDTGNVNDLKPYYPDLFVGDGDPRNHSEYGTDWKTDEFFASHDYPATYYRVIQATDLRGQSDNPEASGYRVVILVATLGASDEKLTFEALCQRVGIDLTNLNQTEALQRLLSKDTVQRHDAILHRSVIP